MCYCKICVYYIAEAIRHNMIGNKVHENMLHSVFVTECGLIILVVLNGHIPLTSVKFYCLEVGVS